MIIDSHAHIGHMIGFNMKGKDLLWSMNEYGIGYSLVSNIECAEYDHQGRKIPLIFQHSQNKTLKKTIDFARKHPDKIGVLAWVKPDGEVADSVFEKLIADNRDIVFGLKLHPFHSRVAPDDERLETYYELAKKYDLAIVSHTGGCEEARPIHLYNAAKAHPELSFVMVHMELGSDNKEALKLLGMLPNLYGDTTWVNVRTAIEAVKLYGSGKMLFGTDNPIDGRDTLRYNKWGERSLYQEYLHGLKKLIDSEAYENLMYKNAQRVFKLTNI